MTEQNHTGNAAQRQQEPFGYLLEKAGVNNGYYFLKPEEYAHVEERSRSLYKPCFLAAQPPAAPVETEDDLDELQSELTDSLKPQGELRDLCLKAAEAIAKLRRRPRSSAETDRDVRRHSGAIMTDFLPCPFCGGDDIRSDRHIDSRSPTREVWSMCCYECGATFPNRYRKELLVENWNRRPAKVIPDLPQTAPVRGPDCACCEQQPRKDCAVPGCSMKDAEWAIPARDTGSLRCLRCGTVDAFGPASEKEAK